jgi:hypothetical protein
MAKKRVHCLLSHRLFSSGENIGPLKTPRRSECCVRLSTPGVSVSIFNLFAS